MVPAGESLFPESKRRRVVLPAPFALQPRQQGGFNYFPGSKCVYIYMVWIRGIHYLQLTESGFQPATPMTHFVDRLIRREKQMSSS